MFLLVYISYIKIGFYVLYIHKRLQPKFYLNINKSDFGGGDREDNVL